MTHSRRPQSSESPAREVVIFGIAPKAMESGLEMTPEVAALVPRVVELVLAEVFSPR